MNQLFDIEKFNIISDDENYYFFRSLEPGDLQDIENGIINTNNGYTRLRTDRERWKDQNPSENPRWNEESQISLEEMFNHIKVNYNLQTNCISLSSNANVAKTYEETFSDKYVVIRVPKKEMGERVFHAGQYMLTEIERLVNEYIDNNDINEGIMRDLKEIDESKTSEEIQDIIKTKY